MKILLKNSTNRNSRVLRSGHSTIGGGAKKRFQYCLNPNSSRHISYFRASHEHSGVTEKIYRVHLPRRGNVSELNSIIRNGLISGGKSLKRGRQAVFFTTVNPMDDEYGMGETPRDPTKPRTAPYKILGNLIRIQYIGAIRNSLKSKDCCFTRQGHMQSSSETHYQLYAWRKWYA